MGDGTLAIFTSDDRGRACDAALAAAVAAQQGVIKLNERRAADGLPLQKCIWAFMSVRSFMATSEARSGLISR